MSVTIEVKTDLRKFNAALTKAKQKQMRQAVQRGITQGVKRQLKIGTQVRPAPFVETGTLHSSHRRGSLRWPHTGARDLALNLVREMKPTNTAVAAWIACKARELARLESRRHLWPRYAVAMALFIAGVAILCG